ncbi:MAG: chemotaxis protein CheV [Pseudomonadota bacterium]|nr:chemotaxis protein CheV [Pseudomonadota bacterium]
MSELLKSIDARTRLAGTNKLEILLFTLGADARTGRRETFGINVFKVREVMRTPQITRAPEMPSGIEGMVSLRSQLTAVIDLARYAHVQTETRPEIMIVTEYNGHSQGFLVEAVDTILRLDWSRMKVPPDMLAVEMGGMVTAVTELEDGRIVMMLDVERILAETTQIDDEIYFRNISRLAQGDRTVFFADDSSVARKQIERTLEAMGVRHISAMNGRKAWEELRRLADYADSRQIAVRELLQLIITDVEMPEMDGYMLTRNIKGDSRFAGIPVIMHSSLSGQSNAQHGKTNGVDAYIPKFEPQRLAEMVTRFLA